MKSSLNAPNKAEREWLYRICELGCIACIVMGYRGTPACPHHMLRGGIRIGHLWTIPLCDPGHHQGAGPGSPKISRHPDKARFEAAYGTEEELHQRTQKLVGITIEAIAA